MKKENDILNFDFIDFDLFVVSDKEYRSENNKSEKSKRILIVYENSNNDPELDSFLKSILLAAKVNIEEQTLLINTTSRDKHSFVSLQKKWQIHDIIFFGLPLQNFGINYSIAPFQPKIINNLRILQVEPLDQIQKNVNLKKALWSCLKEMYLS